MADRIPINLSASSQNRIIVFTLILFIALFSRLYNLDKYSLNYDEAVTVLDERGLDRLPHLGKLFDSNFLVNHHDFLTLYSHGFVYYWQELFGKTEYALRLSSVIFSLFSIGLLYLLASEVLGLRTAYLVIFLFAISPFSINYAQELRPFSASSFFALAAVYSFLKIMKTGKWRYILIYIISNVLNVYFNPSAVMVLFCFAGYFIFNIRKYKMALKLFLVTNAVIVLLLIPVFLSIYYNLNFVLKGSADYAVNGVFGNFPSWRSMVGLKDLLFTIKNFGIGYNVDYFSFIGKFSALIYALLFIFGVFNSRRKSEAQLFLFCLFIPILFLFFMSLIKPCYVDRYFFATFPFYLLFVAAGLNKLVNKFVFISLASVIIGINLFALKNYYFNYLPADQKQHVGLPGKQNIKNAAKAIAFGYKSGDRIMHTCRNTVFPLKFYIRQFSGNSGLIKEADNGSVVFIPSPDKDKTLFVYDYQNLYPNLVFTGEFKMLKDFKSVNRLWLISSDWYFTDAVDSNNNTVKIIKKNLKENKREGFDGEYLYLFSRLD